MKTRICTMLCAAVLLMASAGELAAQEEEESGIAWIIDFIHRLSGPPIISTGPSVFYGRPAEWGTRFRLSATYGTSIREEGKVVPADANITMLTLMPMAEFLVQAIPLEFGVGFAVNRFGGDADGFWHYSVPVQVQWRPRTDRRLVPRVAIRLHAFRRFDETDFEPLDVRVSTDAPEAVWQLSVGLDYRLRLVGP